MTHGVIGNTSDFGSAESWFEPRWVSKSAANEVKAYREAQVGQKVSLFLTFNEYPVEAK